MGLFFTSAIMESNQIWLLAPRQSLLCVLDKKTKESRVVACLAKKNRKDCEKDNGLYYGMIKVNDSIYIFPDRAEQIAVYHILTEKLEYISIDWGSEKWSTSHNKIGTAYSVNNYLYFIGNKIPVIIKMDIKTLEQKLIPVQVENEMWRKTAKIENKIYIPSWYGRKIVIFDVIEDAYKIREIPINVKGIACVEHKGSQLLVVPTDCAEIYEVDVNKWSVDKKYDLSTIKGLQYDQGEIPFMHLFMAKNNYWLLPRNANMIVKINQITGKAESVHIFDDRKKYRYIDAFQWDDKRIFGYYAHGVNLDFCDMETEKIERCTNVLPANIQFYWKNKIKSGYREIINENEIGLSCFLGLL